MAISAVRSSPLAHMVKAFFAAKSSLISRGKLMASGESLMHSPLGAQSNVTLVAQVIGSVPSNPAATAGNAGRASAAMIIAAKPRIAPSDRSLHRIAAPLHASAVGPAPGIVGRLLLVGGLLIVPAMLPDAAEQRAGRSTDGGTLAGIA